jgi:hypothetical protein
MSTNMQHRYDDHAPLEDTAHNTGSTTKDGGESGGRGYRSNTEAGDSDYTTPIILRESKRDFFTWLDELEASCRLR